MTDACVKRDANKRANSKNGSTFQKLVSICSQELENQLTCPPLSSKIETAKRIIELFDSRIFENQFKNLISIKFNNGDSPGSFSFSGGLFVISLSKSLTSQQFLSQILHEMCLIAESFLAPSSFNDWSKRARKEFPEMKILPRCASDVSSECNRCGNGSVFVAGDGECGQLGLGESVDQKSKFSPVKIGQCVQVCAGGLHSLCVTVDGTVFSFGCNDELALGRQTKKESDSFTPEKIWFRDRVDQVSAGGSHSIALTVSGTTFAWGTFRDQNGPIGLLNRHPTIVSKPTRLSINHVIKISSGSDHILFLKENGSVWSMGVNDQGQLGRITKNRQELLSPGLVKIRKRAPVIDLWAFQYGSIVKTMFSEIFAWGLNNYFQLGFLDSSVKWLPEKSTIFNGVNSRMWRSFSGGQHHTLAISVENDLFAIGNKHYGRLGVGKIDSIDEDVPKLHFVMSDCEMASAGSICSFAISKGKLFSWGAFENQLGLGHLREKDVLVPTEVKIKDQKCVSVSAGGQHSLALFCSIKL